MSELYPIFYGFGSTMDLRAPPLPRSRLDGCRSVSRAARDAYAQGAPPPPAQRAIGFRIPKRD